MGHYTDYKLSLEEGVMGAELERALLEKVDDDWCPLMDFMTGDADSCKWYSYERDMIAFSKRFPQCVFKLHGMGEDAGNYWIEWFQDGKTYKWEVNTEHPPFNKTKLR